MKDKKEIVIDIEADKLENPTKIHLIVCREVLSDEVHIFKRKEDFLQFNRHDTVWIGHNIIDYDCGIIRLLWGHDLPICFDTLTFSRLLNYNIKGGHSLEAWGERLGYKKVGVDITDWSELTPEIEERCIQDTKINRELYLLQKKYLDKGNFDEAVRTEQELQLLCSGLHNNGFPFNLKEALSLRSYLQSLIRPIDDGLKEAFPPRAVFLKEVHPRRTKSGALNGNDFRWTDSDLRVFTGGPFSRFYYEEFNPASPKQIVSRLNEAGWKPTEKTKGHREVEKDKSAAGKRRLEEFRRMGWKISEENLKTLPDTAPEATKKLAQRILLASRVSDLEEWINLYNLKTKSIHGRFLGIGSWTHRMAHQKPNMANIPVAKRSDKDNEFERLANDINDDMRRLWIPRKGYRLVGVDADGIQMRIFAHYTGDEKLIEALINGNKEDETDIHSVNRRGLGLNVCRSRDDAKTFIYAWVLGAGTSKISEILRCSIGESKEAVSNFLTNYPGLKLLKSDRIPEDASRGYFEGLDGRLVACSSEHLMLSGYLQNGEKVIMSRAAIAWNRRLKKEGIPYRFLNFVHDEWQTEVPDDDDIASYVAQVQAEELARQTEELSLRCPIRAGSPSFGYSWKETH